MSTSLNKISDALELTELNAEEQEEVLSTIHDLVFRGSLVRLIERMDEPTREAFSALLDTSPSEEDVEAFLTKHVPTASGAVEETIAELTDDILAVTK